MKHFIAQLVFRIECGGMFEGQLEEQWRLILADDETAALLEARKIADSENTVMVDHLGRTVSWQLAAIKHLRPFELENGALLCSQLTEPAPAIDPLRQSEGSQDLRTAMLLLHENRLRNLTCSCCSLPALEKPCS